MKTRFILGFLVVIKIVFQNFPGAPRQVLSTVVSLNFLAEEQRQMNSIISKGIPVAKYFFSRNLGQRVPIS